MPANSFRLQRFVFLIAIAGFFPLQIAAGQGAIKKFDQADKFRQLEEILPTPTSTRTASGAPGPRYWQQKVDYVIKVELDDEKQRIIGSETVTYHNRSPHTLSYLWVQIDNNIFDPKSDANMTRTASGTGLDRVSTDSLKSMLARETFDGSVNITAVKLGSKPLKHTIVGTMMRLDLPTPLLPQKSVQVSIDWNYQINNSKVIPARTGCEFFEEDGNYIYELAHWYPRFASYMDYSGWQHKQFIGRGEFTLELGDYETHITAPDDHIVAATGVLQNADQLLTAAQKQRLEKAKSAKTPVFVVTPEEAKKNEKSKPTGKKTWVFKAKNVRDFAWASSRKFIWDALQHDVEGNKVMAMSFYPNEAEPLWSKYSTHSIVHTLDVYSRYTFQYPYPVAISVNGPVYGMEYPMICFNGPRPEKDGTYSKRTKYALISVIIHEVGHNYFPMIVNSDERQWTWMDEGLNTFLQYLSEQEWEEDYPSRRGEPRDIVGYMRSTNQVPIMINSESILQFGPNAYSKPATALNILRETILGRELFDFAFKEYARRWKFKHPTPADFFRTMEDASGVDLDWFWRGWFYSTDHTDLSIDKVQLFIMKSGDPDIDKPIDKKKKDDQPDSKSKTRNADLDKRLERFPELKDFYNEFDEFAVTEAERKAYKKFVEKLTDEEKELLKQKRNFYFIDFKNIGGLIMPIIIELEFEDGSKREIRIPAEIWRRDNENVTKMVITKKPVARITLDPHLETADTDLSNNHFPRKIVESRFEIYKKKKDEKNEMQKAKEASEKAAKKAKGEDDK